MPETYAKWKEQELLLFRKLHRKACTFVDAVEPEEKTRLFRELREVLGEIHQARCEVEARGWLG